ncbi:MAG TPA: hypothetical protein EYQ63_33150 [Fuerstia sp.]|nr:hypothetical protein [Fuerstiella sp.]
MSFDRNTLEGLMEHRPKDISKEQLEEWYPRADPLIELLQLNERPVMVNFLRVGRIALVYQTLDDSGNPAALGANLISFNLHFDADQLTFVTQYNTPIEFAQGGNFTEGIAVFPIDTRLESDVTVQGDDGDADTETVVVASYSDNDSGVFPGWPNTPLDGSPAPQLAGLELYVARFTVNAGFTGSTINFTANATGNVIGQAAEFGFQSTSLTLSTAPVVLPVVSISDAAAVNEGENSVFNVTLNEASDSTVTVNYSTASGNPPNGANSGTDFTGVTNQTVTFAPGDTSKTINIVTLDDALNEATEEFSVTLVGPAGATLGDAQGIGTINDDTPPLPSLSISDAPAVTEGGDSIFTVSLSAAAAGTVTVTYSTADGNGPTGAIGGDDFVAQSNQTLTFNPGQTQQTVTVSTIDDVINEDTETFTGLLSTPNGATLSVSQATGTINDNDDPVVLPTLSISDAPTVTEGGDSVFTVTLSANPSSPVTVNFATSPTGPNPATSGSDFTANNGTLTFNPGASLTQQIQVVTIDDSIVESSETLAVDLSTPVGATIAAGSAIGTIDDDDVSTGMGSIHGRKYNDLNANGTWESGEPWLNGWTIELVNAAGTVVDQQVTADMDLNDDNEIDPATETGWYWFSAVPGTYTLQEVGQPGWKQTAPADRLPALAYQLDTELMLRQTTNAFENWGGLNEKWILAEGNVWHFITPDGTLYQWDGSASDNLTGIFVASLSPEYHADLSLLSDAAPAQFTTYTLVAGQTLPDVNFGNVNIESPGSIHGRKWNDLNGDGQRSSDEPWLNGWAIELVDVNGSVVQTATTMDMDLNNDNQIDPATESGWYWLNDVPAGDWTVREEVRPGWHQTAPSDPVALEAFELDTDLNLRFSNSLFPNWGGLNERWMLGDDAWYYITPNGDFFRWNGSAKTNLSGDLVAQLAPEYHAEPSTLYDAVNPHEVQVRIDPGDYVTNVDFGNQQDDVPNPDPTNFAGAGNVAARIFGNNLILTGDNAANGVMVSTNQDGWVTVIGLGDTTIAGQNQPWVIDGWTMVPGDLRINLHGGGDAVLLNNLQVGDDVTVNTHGGDDFVLIDELGVTGDLDVRSASGHNSFYIMDTQVGGLVRSITGSGNDALLTDNVWFGGRTIVIARSGNDLFASTNSTLAGDLVLNAGAGNDQVIIQGNTFGSSVTLEGAGGSDSHDIDPSTTSNQAPVIRRFEQDSIGNINDVLDAVMQRLADAGLDGL